MDCRLISKEIRDSLTKVPQRNGISGSKPLDCDLAAQGEAVPRSNRGRAPRIGRSREVGRAGRGGASPELVKQVLQSLVWTAVWCKRESAARVIYWGSDQGSTGVRAACATAQAALDRRRAAWCGRGRATATLSCANGPGGCGGAYRAWNRMGRWCRAAIGRTGGGARRGGASRSE